MKKLKHVHGYNVSKKMTIECFVFFYVFMFCFVIETLQLYPFFVKQEGFKYVSYANFAVFLYFMVWCDFCYIHFNFIEKRSVKFSARHHGV